MAVSTVGLGRSGDVIPRSIVVRDEEILAVVLVLVMSKVAGGGRRLVLAVRRHDRPAELQGHQGKQQDGKPSTHTPEFIGCGVTAQVGAVKAFTVQRLGC